MGSKLLATANAPAFTGNITIVLTDGVTTVNKVIAIDRRPTTVAALFTQILDLVSIAGPIDSFVDFEIVVQTVASEVGFNDSFAFIPMSQLISIAGATDEFLLGASIMADNVTANGVAFNYRFLDASRNIVPSLSQSFYIVVYRILGETPETSESAIGCYTASAEGFRISLLDAVRLKFGIPGIQQDTCNITTTSSESPITIVYEYILEANPGN